MTLIYGLAALGLLWWLSQVLARSNPTALAGTLKWVGGIACLGGAVLLGVRGRFDMALFLGPIGLWLLGVRGFGLPSLTKRTAKAAGSVSRVRSAMIEMELQHDTGAMDGTVLAGALSGRRLESLDTAALTRLYEECRLADPEGLRLLEAYLDRRLPGWREHAQADADPGPVHRPETGVMTDQEAYEILGLQPGAGADEVRAAHRALMKKLHPDQGGSTYLAARVNAAKERLLSRHR